MITEIGEHRVKCGNVMLGISDLMKGETADIMYSDPPWGEGNLRYWQTINIRHQPGAVRESVNLSSFLHSVFGCTKLVRNMVFIEYGIKWKDNIIALGAQYNLLHQGVIETIYASGSKDLPMHLHVFSKLNQSKLSPEYISSVYHTKGLETLRAAIKPYSIKDGILLDPCCGMGYSAQIALETGMRFRGNELNKSRLQKTIKRLENISK